MYINNLYKIQNNTYLQLTFYNILQYFNIIYINKFINMYVCEHITAHTIP